MSRGKSVRDAVAYSGRQVRMERTARGWNLHEFGQMIAYRPAAISRVETGKRPPTESFADQCDRVFPERNCWFHESTHGRSQTSSNNPR
jgi:ribosome-binding protein aMBF1 (putative translation factor)